MQRSPREIMRTVLEARLHGHVWIAKLECSTGSAAEGSSNLTFQCDDQVKSALAGLEMTAYQLAHIGNTAHESGLDAHCRMIGEASSTAILIADELRSRGMRMAEGRPLSDNVGAPRWFALLRELLRCSPPGDTIELEIPCARSWIITQEKRCNRGRFLWQVESRDQTQLTIDSADLFPRYYFSLDALLVELSAWLDARSVELAGINPVK